MEDKEIIKSFGQKEGIIEGIASHFGFPADRDGDVIHESAFDETIKEINENGIPLLDGHQRGSVKAVIGTVFEAKKEGNKLMFKAKLADIDSNTEIFEKIEQRHIRSVSIGMRVHKLGLVRKGKRAFRQIEKADLHEISLVAIPANPNAQLLVTKSYSEDSGIDLPEDYLNALETKCADEECSHTAVAEKTQPEAKEQSSEQKPQEPQQKSEQEPKVEATPKIERVTNTEILASKLSILRTELDITQGKNK